MKLAPETGDFVFLAFVLCPGNKMLLGVLGNGIKWRKVKNRWSHINSLKWFTTLRFVH